MQKGGQCTHPLDVQKVVLDYGGQPRGVTRLGTSIISMQGGVGSATRVGVADGAEAKDVQALSNLHAFQQRMKRDAVLGPSRGKTLEGKGNIGRIPKYFAGRGESSMGKRIRSQKPSRKGLEALTTAIHDP